MDINKLYTQFNEDERLNTSKASSIEFLTTTHYIDKYLFEGMKICDVGAGTGIYSLFYANKGYDVTAIELVEHHLDCLKGKITEEMNLSATQGNALDLSRFKDETFDIVLCFGPLYHLESDEDKKKSIKEAQRVCKKNGLIFYAYLSNDMVFITETFLYNQHNLGSNNYEHASFKIVDDPFCFMTVGKMKSLMDETGMKMVTQFSADGLAELLSNKINQFTDEQFNEWMRYHLYACEKEELVGYSNHIVYVARKT